uniref:Uncharacterized protein n=1 Tax=Pyrodinium bahamense TaxID=73915 RepID=A0A7S0B7Q4_9DINO|mmetsp:Transcript_53453/g.148104  ORF Transcript_53453/g.148104 Transcript_53453/m.148104 type:complete len:179 (+) Transcript_53453:867-1403(+)
MSWLMPFLIEPFGNTLDLVPLVATFAAAAVVTYYCDDLAAAVLRRMPECSERPDPARAGVELLQFVQVVRERRIGWYLLPGYPSVNHLRFGPALLTKSTMPCLASAAVKVFAKAVADLNAFYEGKSRDTSFFLVFYGAAGLMVTFLSAVFWAACSCRRPRHEPHGGESMGALVNVGEA